jgi:hypothetical protein
MSKPSSKPVTVGDLLGALDATRDYVVGIRKLLQGLPASTPLKKRVGAAGGAAPKLRIRRACPPPK